MDKLTNVKNSDAYIARLVEVALRSSERMTGHIPDFGMAVLGRGARGA